MVIVLLILSLDTTTRAGSVAIADDDRVLAAHAGDPTRTHGERLPGEIDAVLADAGIARSAVDLLVVASGPGAFTGLRIGLAAMQGLAMALNRPIVGVSALEALAWTVLASGVEGGAHGPDDRGRAVATWMDAQRGEVFSALYRGNPKAELPWPTAAEPAVGSPDAILASQPFDRAEPAIFIGDGARRYADIIRAASACWAVSLEEPLLAPVLTWIGRRLAADSHTTLPHALQPLYVRRPDAEIERERLGRRSPSGGPVRRSPSGGGGSTKGEGGRMP